MTTIAGYQILEKIHEGEKSKVFRAVQESNQLPVIVKTLKESNPSSEELSQLQQEFNIGKNLEIPGILKAFELVKSVEGMALVIEDIGGQSLRQYLSTRTLSVNDFLEIAMQLGKIVGDLHSKNIIHKDIKPDNIIISPDAQEVRITDFSLASQVAYQTQELCNPEKLEGTFAYMSPEQTGRVHRAIDYRSDFYSLGITFYEMLVGELPFQHTDLLELIHAHIAKKPEAPHKKRAEIPIMVSKIIQKLIAKSPDDRYQQACGLLEDLETCRIQWEAKETILEFPLGALDQASQFQPLDRCVDREKDLSRLREAYDRIALGYSELLTVTGYTGIGKTALVQELARPVEQEGGIFVTGHCDQVKTEIPFHPIIQAFQGLIHKMLTKNQTQLDEWKTNINRAVHPNGQVLIDVFPEAELIIGKQPDVAPLAPMEAKNRFNLVLQNFIAVLTKFDHPLVLFLDDLQWADSATLQFIQQYATDSELSYLLMIGAFRDHEITESHPLAQTLESIPATQNTASNIKLNPLNEDQVGEWVSISLKTEIADIAPLAHLIFSKTQGNPLFVKNLLATLQEEKILFFDFFVKRWTWDSDLIKQQSVSENVVDLMVKKLKKLTKRGQNVVEMAACIGNHFDLDLLSAISGCSLDAAQTEIWVMLQEGIVEHAPDNAFSSKVYGFVHSRIREAAYSMLSDELKLEIHLKVGNMGVERMSRENIEIHIFEIVNHLNVARPLIDEEFQKTRLASLNLIAGKKAKQTSAFEQAWNYLKTGIELLPPQPWQTAYDICYELHLHCSECAFLNTQFDDAEQYFGTIWEHAKTGIEKANVGLIQMELYTNQGLHEKTIDVGIASLKELGVDIEEFLRPEPDEVLLEIHKHLQEIGMEKLFALPELDDAIYTHISRVYTHMGPAFYSLGRSGNSLSAKFIRMSLKHGMSPEAALSFGGFGVILGQAFGKFKEGRQYFELSLKFTERYGNVFHRCRANHLYGLMGAWTRHFRHSFKYLDRGYQFGVEGGDFVYASYAISTLAAFVLLSDSNLKGAYKSTRKAMSFAKKIRSRDITDFCIALEHSILHGQGKPVESTNWLGETIGQEALEQHVREGGSVSNLSWYYAIHISSLYLDGDTVGCWQVIEAMDELKGLNLVGIHIPIFCFYHALLLAARLAESDVLDSEDLESLQDIEQRYQNWSANCPENFEHKHLVIRAETLRLQDKPFEALRLYDQAVESAKKYDFIRHAAIIHERIADFHFKENFAVYARHHIEQAHYLFGRWGGTAKVEALEMKYPEIFDTFVNKGSLTHLTTVVGTTSNGNSIDLDFGSLMKTSQAISQEIVLSELLKKLLSVLIENAGAEKGALVLERNHKFYIEAEGNADESEAVIFDPVPLEHPEVSGYVPRLPIKLIQYAALAKETVVLHDAANEGLFTKIPYVLKHQPKSILCSPIRLKSEVIGLIYLENRLTTGVFTPGRLEVLNLLTAQAAISIENARLYEAYGRFVPHAFLNLLNKKSILDVQLGDQIQEAMSIIFADVRDFTKLSEGMTPEENFLFLNSYLKTMGPIIRQNGGFIDKYIGDAIMALFDKSEDDAVQAGIAMLKELAKFNLKRVDKGLMPVRVGLGINTGNLMLGTIGEYDRMEGTVISDAVNLASRIEGMTKQYGTPLLIGERTYFGLKDRERYAIRFLDRVKVKGKTEAVTVYEVCDADPEILKDYKMHTASMFEKAWKHFSRAEFEKAAELFKDVQMQNPHDQAPQVYLERIEHHLLMGVDEHWDGITQLESK